MAYIKKIENVRLVPCNDNPYFIKSPERWRALKLGKPVFVPDEDVEYHLGFFGACIEVVQGEEAPEPEAQETMTEFPE